MSSSVNVDDEEQLEELPSLPPSLVRDLSDKSDELVRRASLEEEKKHHYLSHPEVDTNDTKKEHEPWELLEKAITDTVKKESINRGKIREEGKTTSGPDPVTLQRLAKHAVHTIEKRRDILWGPQGLIPSASCFNWALCGGKLGYDDFSAWPPALFDWVSVAERSRYPWRSEGKPWKNISLVAVQRRCAQTLSKLHPKFRKELDDITARHLKRVGKLSKKEWEANGAELETLVAKDVMSLAARIAGMEPCNPSSTSFILGMRGRPGIACNFTHWWLEMPTGRKYRSGEPERVRCETYPNAPVYFTPCYPGQTPRGTFRVHVKGIKSEHFNVIALALTEN